MLDNITDFAVIYRYRERRPPPIPLSVIAFPSTLIRSKTMVQLIEAIAQSPARRVTTKFGERTVIDAIRRDNGEKITVWRSGDDIYSQKHVIRNARLTFTLDNKGKYSLVEDPNLVNLGTPLPDEPIPVKPVYTPSPQSDPNFSPEKKAEIAEYVANLAQLYQHCQDKAEDIALTPDDCRAIGTTLFIQTVKHFNL